MFCQDFTGAIGATPLIRLGRVMEVFGLQAELLAKFEAMNPAGSAKDRVGLALIEDAERRGLLKPGATIIEPTSGNTGIGLAAVAAVKGYRVILTMPDTMSAERRALLAAYGAELVLTPGEKGMAGAIQRAQEMADAIPGSFIPGQFENPANADIHFRTTGPEIWQDSRGRVDLFVAGIGTGGTITGVGRYLKQQKPDVRIVGVEPAESPVLTQGRSGPHGIQGIGANFVPPVLDRSVLDLVVPVTLEDALETGRRLPRLEGLLAGISSGAALWAAIEQCRLSENAGRTVVVLLPDTGERYLSSGLFQSPGAEAAQA